MMHEKHMKASARFVRSKTAWLPILMPPNWWFVSWLNWYAKAAVPSKLEDDDLYLFHSAEVEKDGMIAPSRLEPKRFIWYMSYRQLRWVLVLMWEEPVGNMIIDIGGGTNRYYCYCPGRYRMRSKYQSGGDEFTADIMEAQRRYHSFIDWGAHRRADKNSNWRCNERFDNPPDDIPVKPRARPGYRWS